VVKVVVVTKEVKALKDLVVEQDLQDTEDHKEIKVV